MGLSDVINIGVDYWGDVNRELHEAAGEHWVVDEPAHYVTVQRDARVPYIDHTAGAILQGTLVTGAVLQAAAQGVGALAPIIAKLVAAGA